MDVEKLEKKLERKTKRFAGRLRNFKGIQCEDKSGPNIVLCNVGQATGLEKEAILNLLKDLGGIKLLKFIALKGESHSFLVFSNTEDADLFYKTWNGKAITGGSRTPVYMSYVENVPNTEMICPDKDPDGLTIIQNFISAEEEKQFLELFDWVEESNLKNRLVKHYGYEFRYGSNDVDLTSPLEAKIPAQCDVLWKKLRENGIEFEIPDQLTVNKYSPGQGIPSHVDRHSPFGNTILSLSLGSSVLMDWKHHSGTYIPVVVTSRSLLVMQGEARYDWQHGIQPRTWDNVVEVRTEPSPARVITQETVPRGTRISLTFRKTRQGPCDCGYKVLCDSGGPKVITDDVASDLEEMHVHKVYEQIAGHFSTTRRVRWPQVTRFVQTVQPGAVLLDLGAGNGKNLIRRGDILQLACERSSYLLVECQNHLADFGSADCVRLDLLQTGLRDACADIILCVAVIHHLSSAARRRLAVSSIARLLRSGGRALITVWAMDQTGTNYLCEGKQGNSTRFSTVRGVNLPVHENRTPFLQSDLLVPWKLRSLVSDDKITLLRYYHIFEEGELESLCAIPELSVESSFNEEGNWGVIVKKI